MDDTLVFNALRTLYMAGDASKKQEASRWLEDFQQRPEAWMVADRLLNVEGTELEFQAFGAQMLRNKITYDLSQLDDAAKYSLRSAIFSLLQNKYVKGPRIILSHLCLALSGLALQMEAWVNPFQDAVNAFSSNPVVLLEFLTALPDEIRNNSRITAPVDKVDLFAQRANSVLTANAGEVLQLLIAFLQQKSSEGNQHVEVFRCLLSWIRSNDISVKHLIHHPVIGVVFQALVTDDLHELACDVICQIIRESSDIQTAYPLVEEILKHLEQCLPLVTKSKQEEDEEKQRGLCRVYTEAGESFLPLVSTNHPRFPMIVKGIYECTTFHDLDIVPITFNFWYEFTRIITQPELSEVKALYLEIYRSLIDVMIGHLRYPSDGDAMTAEDRDEFREFRHIMGDVLKDCCVVLGDQESLSRPFQLLCSFIKSSPITSSWQEIEAPLFSLRSMGSEIADTESVMLPQIMQLIPHLPEHPKLRYAATLVIGRYSNWTKNHPEFIAQQLQYISVGFNDIEISAASALSLKYLCESCEALMIDYLDQLHPFYVTALSKLQQFDAMELTEAIAHIVKAVPSDKLLQTIQIFCLPVAQRLQELSCTKIGNESAENGKELGTYLERLNVFLKHVRPVWPPGSPHPCVLLLQELWPVFDSISKNYTEPYVSESLCKCFKNAIVNYESHFLPLVLPLVNLLNECYSRTGNSCYLWIASHVVHKYGKTNDSSLNQSFQTLFETICHSTFKLLPNIARLNQEPDATEDFFHLLSTYAKQSPQILYTSYLLPSLMSYSIMAIDCQLADASERVLWWLRDFFQSVLDDDQKQASPFFSNAQIIGQQFGQDMCTAIMLGITGTGPSGIPMSGKLFRAASAVIHYYSVVTTFEVAQRALMNSLVSFDAKKFTDTVKLEFMECCKISAASGKLEPLRHGLTKLGSTFRGKSQQAPPRRKLEY